MSAKTIKVGKLAKAVKITDPLEMVGFIRTNGTQCQFVSMLTVTEPKLKKTCPFKNVIKISRRNGLINMNYNKAVRSRIAENLGIELADVEYDNGNVWFKHDLTEDGKTLPLVVNKNKDDGKYYVQFFPVRTSGTKYMSNGEVISKEQLEPYFYAEREVSEFKPITCVFHVGNIKELHASRVIVKTNETDKMQAVLTP